jgi:hypothetical protein
MNLEGCTTVRTYCLPGRSDESRKRQVNGNRSRCLGFWRLMSNQRGSAIYAIQWERNFAVRYEDWMLTLTNAKKPLS